MGEAIYTIVVIAIVGIVGWRLSGEHLKKNAHKVGLSDSNGQMREWCDLLKSKGWVESPHDILMKKISIEYMKGNKKECAAFTRVLDMSGRMNLTSKIIGRIISISESGKTIIKHHGFELDTRTEKNDKPETRKYIWYQRMVACYNKVAVITKTDVSFLTACDYDRHHRPVGDIREYDECVECHQIIELNRKEYEDYHAPRHWL